MSTTVIGVSFGNTTSSIAIERDGKVEIIANQDGDRAIPSVLSYLDNNEFHGQEAKNQLVRNHRNTVTKFRDALGRKFDAETDPDRFCTCCPPEPGPKDDISFSLQDGGHVPVCHVTTRHIARLAESASAFLGRTVNSGVIAVPTDFSDRQRDELARAAEAAGLKVLQLVHEPVAAVLAHVTHNHVIQRDAVYVVLDFGASRADGAVVAVRGGLATLLATKHATGIAGDALDDVLCDFIAKEFAEKYPGVDARESARSSAKLRAEAERVKRTLSNTPTANVAIESLAGGFDFFTTINRLRLELLARPVFARVADFVRSLLHQANLDPLHIDSVLFVGGCSHVPKLVATVEGLFDLDRTASVSAVSAVSTGTKASALKTIPPDELVARGAALHAAIIQDFEDREIHDSLKPVVTVAYHTTKPIGVKTVSGGLQVLVDAHTALPVKRTVALRKSDLSKSDHVTIQVYEGETEIVVSQAPQSTPSADDAEDPEDEPEEVRERVLHPARLLAEIQAGNVLTETVDMVVNISRESEVVLAVRAGDNVVKGSL